MTTAATPGGSGDPIAVLVEDAAPRSGDFVQSLERGLAVIRAFDAASPQLTLSEVARRTGLTRAAARRFLLTLVQLGYMQTDGRQFALRPRVLELGYAYLSSLTLPQVAQPHLERLVEQVRESASVSVLDGSDVVYVARVQARRIMTVSISVGTRFPAHATSMGRVLLAGLPEPELEDYLTSVELPALTPRTVIDAAQLRRTLARVAAQGYAVVDQELEEGLRSIATPIRAADGVVAAINVSVQASRGTVDQLCSELLDPLRSAAQHIAVDLGSRTGAQPSPASA